MSENNIRGVLALLCPVQQVNSTACQPRAANAHVPPELDWFTDMGAGIPEVAAVNATQVNITQWSLVWGQVLLR